MNARKRRVVVMVKVMKQYFAMALLIAGLGYPNGLSAQERVRLGVGSIFNNDYLGDNRDRWRTGSYQIGIIRGPEGTTGAPSELGQVLEFRMRGETIAPRSLISPAAGDRLYAGTLAFGVHTYSKTDNTELAFGLDLGIVGPQSGIRSFQEKVHQIVGATIPNVAGFEVANRLRPHLTFEAGQLLSQNQTAFMRPFVEVQAGLETLARAGIDFSFGKFDSAGLKLRDPVTGQRVSGINGKTNETSFMMGADFAWVADSVYLPRARGYAPTDMRFRARAGIRQAWEKGYLFYGLTYLGEEFVGQPEGQYIGSLNIRINF